MVCFPPSRIEDMSDRVSKVTVSGHIRPIPIDKATSIAEKEGISSVEYNRHRLSLIKKNLVKYVISIYL